MICSNCGKELPENTKFCNYCGAVQNMTEPQPEHGSSKKKIFPIAVIGVVVLAAVFGGKMLGQGSGKSGGQSSDSAGKTAQNTEEISKEREKAWEAAQYGAVYEKKDGFVQAFLNYGTLEFIIDEPDDFSLITEEGRDYLSAMGGQLKIAARHTKEDVPYNVTDEEKWLEQFRNENNAPKAEMVRFQKYSTKTGEFGTEDGTRYIIREDPEKDIFHGYITVYKDTNVQETIGFVISAFSREALLVMQNYLDWVMAGNTPKEVPNGAAAGDWESITKAGDAEAENKVSVAWGDGSVPENYVSHGEAHVKVVGAEAVRSRHQDDEGKKNVLRIYYEFTNLSGDGRLCDASYYGIRKLTQDGQTYEQTIGTASEYDYEFLEGPGIHGAWYNNSWTYIYPGVTLLTYEEFYYNPEGGKVQISFADDEGLSVEFDPTNLPGPPKEAPVVKPIENPQYTKGMQAEGDLVGFDGDYRVKITGCEIVPAREDEGTINPSGTKAVLRVYFDYTNTSLMTTQKPTGNATIVGMQDGVELWLGEPCDGVESDYVKEAAPGKTVQVSRCFALRTENPAEIIFEYLDENPVGVRVNLK